MPELPEVETIRHVLEKKIKGRTILKMQVQGTPGGLSRLLRDLKQQVPQIQRRVLQQKIIGVQRRAKYLLVLLKPGILVFHLGMTGQLFADTRGKAPEGLTVQLPDKHTHLILDLSGGMRLYFRDIRKFGRVRFLEPDHAVDYFSRLGPEPLSREFTPDVLQARIKGKQTSIKALLLNQSRVAGLGNIYVDEALFRAGILPRRSASGLRPEQIRKLHTAIQTVLQEAIRYRGTTFSDYFDPESRRGGFQERLQVYGRAGQPCQTCGKTIQKGVVAQRGTHWCAHCQT